MSVVFKYSKSHEAYFKAAGQKVFLKKAQYIVSPHERSGWVYFLAEGLVTVQFSFQDGTERLIGYFLPGMSFAQTGAFFDDSGGDLEYITSTSIVAYRMPFEQFLAHLDEDAEFNKDYIDWLLKVQVLLIERIVYQGEGTLRRKILRWMVFMAKYYGKPLEDGKTQIYIPVTRSTIASFLHVSREGVTKEMKLLEPKQVFEFNAKILVVDVAAIHQIIDEH